MKTQSNTRLQVVGKTFECGEQVHLVSINGEHPEPMTSAALAQAKELTVKKSESNSLILIDAQRTRTNSKTTSAQIWNRLLNIAQQRNVEVFLTNMVGLGDGALLQYKDKKVILIEGNVSKRKRNVFLSHELGHLQLHADTPAMKPLLSSEVSPAAEREAEYFGRKLRRYLERSLSISKPDNLPAA